MAYNSTCSNFKIHKNLFAGKLFSFAGFLNLLINYSKSLKDRRYTEIAHISQSYLFDYVFYSNQFCDLDSNNFKNLVEHYVFHGAEEGRDPAPWFSTVNYLNNNPDVRESNMNPFFHYIMYGFKEGRRI